MATKTQTLVKQLWKIANHSCMKCDYDEACGGLVNHCDACCRKITQAVFALAHTKMYPKRKGG